MFRSHSYHGFSGHHHGEGRGCSCCGGVSVRRRYFSSEERKEMLEEYRDELKKELKGVEEEIKRIGS